MRFFLFQAALALAICAWFSLYGFLTTIPCGDPEDPAQFWDCAKRLGDKIKNKADEELDDGRRNFQDVSDRIVFFEEQARKVAESSVRLGRQIIDDPVLVQNLLQEAVDDAMRLLKEEFPPPDTADGRTERREHMAHTLDVIFERVIAILSQHTDLSEEDVTKELAGVRIALEDFLVVTGDLVELHPRLVEALLISGTVAIGLAVPEGFFLRPILSGVGFGPGGVVKGSIAAWAQRFFWGGAVKRGSWFALLQRAGATIGSIDFFEWLRNAFLFLLSFLP